MEYIELGDTGHLVSVAGLGCGGSSRLGLTRGKSHDEAVALVREALDLGVNLLDTAPSYQTERVVGAAVRETDRSKVTVSTKARIHRGQDKVSPQEVVASLDQSLRSLDTDYVDIFQLHAVPLAMYDYAHDEIVPILLREQEKGKIRWLGITEAPALDLDHELLQRTVEDGWASVIMVGFSMMHQNARERLLPEAISNKVGTLASYAVRSVFSRPERMKEVVGDLVVQGHLPAWMAEGDDPLGFLLGDGGAQSIIDAAYRFVRHEPGVSVVLFGTGDIGHLKSNVDSILAPPLPAATCQRAKDLFGHLRGVGLDYADHLQNSQNGSADPSLNTLR